MTETMSKTESACLRAASQSGGYAMYAAVQKNAAIRLKRKGLVTIESGPTKFGTVKLVESAILSQSQEG